MWTGSEGGWLTSFHVPSMERHSSVHAHNTRVVGLQSLPDIGMLSISESHAKLHSAGGFLHWSCSDDVRITSSLCDSPGAVTRPLRLVGQLRV